MDMNQKISILIGVICIGIGILTVVHNWAVDTLGELRYMLRCARERRNLGPSNPEMDREVEELEEKVKNYWGRKLIIKRLDFSEFDAMPTPGQKKNYPKLSLKILEESLKM